MPTHPDNITIRLSKEDREEAQKKAAWYGLPSVSAVLRFALRQLPKPRK